MPRTRGDPAGPFVSAVPRNAMPRIRPMRHRDVIDVAGIEARAYDYPWSEGIFRDCLLAGYPSRVVEQERDILGYSVMSIAAGEAHLLNICIDPDCQGQGRGRALLAYMLELAQREGAARVFLEVRPSNRPALALYRDTGFEVIGLRRGYYRAPGGTEDAMVLVRRFVAQPGARR